MRTYAFRVKPISFSHCAIALAAALLTGCRSAPTQSQFARAYPEAATHAPKTLDVQVVRKTYSIELSNTTAAPFPKGTIWLNRRYSLPIEGLAVGEHAEFKLRQFVDEFSEPFRGGGFFAVEQPETLVMAEFEPAEQNTLLGMVVVRGQAE